MNPLPNSLKSFARPWWPSLAFVVIVLLLFKSLWWDGKILGFRDSLHFYYPLWTYFDSLPIADRIMPKWNSLDAFGSSIIGEPTSMVFYPFRFLLHLPIGNIESRIGWFLVFHFMLAYGTWLLMGLRFRLDPLLVQLTGVGYALSGPIFFQIYNPPFLVGAAWLPAAMAGVLGIVASTSTTSIQTLLNLRRLSFKQVFSVDVLILSFSLVMMVLGGDAQTAFHVGLLTILMLLGLTFQSIFTNRLQFKSMLGIVEPFTKLFVALLISAGISAVQIVPTISWLKHSERIESKSISATATSTLNDHPSTLNPHNRLGFFQQPWHFVTLIAPNVFGSFTPVHTRWAQAIPGDGRVWVPSLHVGTLVGILAILNWCFGWRSIFSKLSLFIAVIAFFSCLGEGGLYDIWTRWIPGYGYFRYPSKWVTFVAWAVCFAASQGFGGEQGLFERSKQVEFNGGENLQERYRVSLRVAFFAVGFFGLILTFLHFTIVLFPSALNSIYQFLSIIPDDPWCGPLNPQQAIRNFGRSGIVICIVGWLSAYSLRFQPDLIHLSRPIVRNLLIAICISELTYAAWDEACFIRSDCLDRRAGFQPVEGIVDLAGWKPVPNISHSAQPNPIPKETEKMVLTAAEKLAMLQSQFLLGKMHLLADVRNFEAQFTFRPRMISATMNRSPSAYWLHRILPVSDQTVLEIGDGSLDSQIAFRNFSIKDSRIDFGYTSESPLAFEIPMFNDGGWQIRSGVSDHQKIVKTKTELVTIILTPGEYQVSLFYWPPGLSIGIWISSISFGAVAIVCFLNSKFLPAR